MANIRIVNNGGIAINQQLCLDHGMLIVPPKKDRKTCFQNGVDRIDDIYHPSVQVSQFSIYFGAAL